MGPDSHMTMAEMAAELEAARRRIGELERMLALRPAGADLPFVQDLLDLLPFPVFLKDVQGTYLACNAAFEQLAGVSRDRIAGRTDRDVRLPCLAAWREDWEAELLRTGRAQICEAAFPSDEGGTVEAMLHMAAWRRPDGAVAGLIGTVDLSCRRRIDRALRESEERLRLTLEATMDGYYDLCMDSGKEHHSDAWLRRLGYEPGEVPHTRQGWIDLLHPEDRDAVVQEEDAFLSGAQALYESVYRIRARDGSWRWALNRGWVVERRPDGSARRVVGATLDITARKRAEDALRESETRANALFEQMAVGAAEAAADSGHFLRINQKYCDITGRTREEMLRLRWQDITHPDDVHTDEEGMKRLAAGEIQSFSMEKRYVRPDGTMVWVHVTVSPLWVPDTGGPSRHIAVVEDITERKRSAERLAVLAHDLGERVKELNCLYGIYKLMEREDAHLDALFQEAANLLPPAWQYPEVACARILHQDREFRTVRFRETPWQQTAEIFTWGVRTGSVQICYLQERPPSDEGPFLQEERNLLDAVADHLGRMVERQEARETLVRAKEAAEAASRSKSEFLANMSHEIRTPLNGLIGMLQLLHATEVTKEQEEFVQLALSSGRNLLRLLSDILDLSMVEAGKLKLVEEPFHTEHLLHAVLDNFRDQARLKSIGLALRIDEQMPQWLIGDVGRLRQILLNLVGNAVKFTEEGQVSLDATLLERTGEGARLLFTVADTGIGIPRQKLEAMFAPFAQADASYTRKYGGAGLGLSIAKRLADLLGGSLGIESEEGLGATVWLSLPLRLPRSGEIPIGEAERDAEMERQGKPRRRVLLAEDDPVNQEVLSRLLERGGYDAAVAANGQEALDALAKDGYDLVLMDIKMPVMDGVEAVRRIRQAEGGASRIPVIALTAYAMVGDRERFLEAGMDEHIAKPVEADHLYAVIEQVLVRKSSDAGA